MARNRVIYQSEALYVSEDASSTGVAKHEQLQRVQSANYSFNISRQDINQYGQLGRIDSIVLESPTVSFDASYYLGDGFNEQALGFGEDDSFGVGFASGHMTATSGKNLYILTVPEGNDAIDAPDSNLSVIGIGNAYLTDYTVDASVGSIPTVSVSFEAANISANNAISGSAAGYSGFKSAAISQAEGTKLDSDIEIAAPTTGVGTITALRPGDIDITFGTASTDAEDGPIIDISSDEDGAHIQSASLSIGMSRSPLERLGTKFPFARTVDFPVTASLSVSAIVNEVTSANLVDIISSQQGVTIQVTFKDPDGVAQSSYKLLNAKLDSESFSSAIGSNKTADLTFSVQIGGPSDTTNNILFSGANGTNPFA